MRCVSIVVRGSGTEHLRVGVVAGLCAQHSLYTPLSESFPSWLSKSHVLLIPLHFATSPPAARQALHQDTRCLQQWTPLLLGRSSLAPCPGSRPILLPLPWGPGSLPHHRLLLLLPSEALQNILTHPLTQVESISVPTFCTLMGWRSQLSFWGWEGES